MSDEESERKDSHVCNIIQYRGLNIDAFRIICMVLDRFIVVVGKRVAISATGYSEGLEKGTARLMTGASERVNERERICGWK